MEKLDFTKPETLQTRDGKTVRIYATDGCDGYPVHGAFFSDGWQTATWTLEGIWYLADASSENGLDLITKPPRVTGWVNVYLGNGSVVFMSEVYQDLAEAKKWASETCLGQAHIDAEVKP